MPIETICTGCGKRLQVDDQHAGRQARCPVCGTVYVVAGQPISGSSLADTVAGSPVSAVNATSDPSRLDKTTEALSPDPRIQPSGEDKAALDGTYWARTPDGNVYGPADHSSVKRWIQEGRLNVACSLRVGEQGEWRPAANLFPELSPNVYASSPQESTQPQPYAAPVFVSSGLQPDRSVLVLVMGILSWVTCFCFIGFIFSIIGVVIGQSDLKSMSAGKMDQTNRSMTQVGYYLALISLILNILGFVFYVGMSGLNGLLRM